MSIGHLLHAAAVTLRISVPTIYEGLRGTLTPEVCDARLDWWSRQLVRRAAIDLHVTGAERARTGSAFVVMSNHQSHYDIPVLYQSLPLRLRMVAKSVPYSNLGSGHAGGRLRRAGPRRAGPRHPEPRSR
jgi:Acyltransferase